MFDWNDLQFFLELSRSGKLTQAAKKLNVEPTTVGRRITRLENDLEVHLFDRSPKGYTIAEAGRKLLPDAERIETTVVSIHQSISGKDTELTGTVRMAVPEGLGVGIISKHIGDFRKLHPGIKLELLADTRARSLSQREADIAITLARPATGRLVAWKLGEYKLALYANHDYLQEHGEINSVADLTQHKFISYINDQIEFPQLKYLQDLLSGANVVFRSSSLQAQYQAVIDNVGLALLHCFLVAEDQNLKAILPDEIFAIREYWMVVHEDLRPLARVKAVSDFFTQVIKNEQKKLMKIS
ncbi:MAG: LysR family transcriptional regulator [Gammaproteobacteria bacterium]